MSKGSLLAVSCLAVLCGARSIEAPNARRGDIGGLAQARFESLGSFTGPGEGMSSTVAICRLAAGPDGRLYGSSASPGYLMQFDPATGRRSALGLVPGAEAYSMLAAHGRLFIGSCAGAALHVFDTAKPFSPGETRANNPAHYGQAAPHQDRIYDIARGADGRVYLACAPASGYHGGAIAWWDPATDNVDSVATPVPDQAIASICALKDGLLCCGTSIDGGPGTKPKATEAVMLLWDPKTRQKLFECVPLPSAAIINNVAAGSDGLVYGTSGGSLFVFDPKARRMLNWVEIRPGHAVRAGLVNLPDGRLALLAGNAALFVRFLGSRWELREFARFEKPITVGKAVVGDDLYAASGSQLIRCRIPPP